MPLSWRRCLRAMGYVHHGKGFRHPERRLIFVGDLIDRGPKQQRVVEIVRSMVEHGDAIVVMGNHCCPVKHRSVPTVVNS